MTTAAAEYKPIFDWSTPRSRKLTMIGFVAASAAVHALCFYIFQIIYPPTIALIPPPARVSVIDSATEEGRVLLRWIEAEDPALSSFTQRPNESGNLALPKVEHVPSYLATRPVLRNLPPYQPDLRVPSPRPPAPVSTSYAIPQQINAITPTSVKFSEEISARGAAQMPPSQFTSATRDLPQMAQFRIAVGGQGEVRYCFLQNSSGDPALDEQARHQLLLSRFPSSERDLTWGIASFEWGNDVATPP